MSFIPCDYCGKESPHLNYTRRLGERPTNVCDGCNVELAELGLQLRQIETPFGSMQSIEPKAPASSCENAERAALTIRPDLLAHADPKLDLEEVVNALLEGWLVRQLYERGIE